MKHITDERRAAMASDRATLLAWLRFFASVGAGLLLGVALYPGVAWLPRALFTWSKTA